MTDLDMLRHIPKNEMSPICEAKVFSGTSSYFLGFDTKNTTREALGYLVPNNQIRRAAYLSVKLFKNVTIKDKTEVKKVMTDETRGTVHLSNGDKLTASLIVAADSRFSTTRKQMGIPASIKDFGRTAIVCRMTHDQSHGKVAHECFFDDWTLAILPLQGNKSSIVITLPTDQAEDVLSMSAPAFNARIEKDLGDRLGKMKLVGERYAYPLVAVYASRFSCERFALMGDAAIGMHPVTAHGYNLGLSGANILAQEIRQALSVGIDIADKTVLDAYALTHKRASAFLYYGTNAMVSVYTNNHPAALIVRSLGLRLANHLSPFKRYVRRQLTGKAA
jgi:ubiquinone biosynthesis UbiH/UbiF/VisC/COQ6 family hydroxylase